MIAGGPVSLRQLHQSTRCPPGCAEGACIIDSRLGGYRCTRCVNTLVTNDSDGRCSCPPGRYAKNGSLDCSDCSKGSYCVGGSFTLEGLVPQKAECGADLTTLGKRATSVQACGECLLAAWNPPVVLAGAWNPPVGPPSLESVGQAQVMPAPVCSSSHPHATQTLSCGMTDWHFTGKEWGRVMPSVSGPSYLSKGPGPDRTLLKVFVLLPLSCVPAQ